MHRKDNDMSNENNNFENSNYDNNTFTTTYEPIPTEQPGNGSSDQKRTNFTIGTTSISNLLFGILLLVAAAYVLTRKLGFWDILLHGMSVWTLILTIFLVVILVEGVEKKSFGQILVPAALLLCVHSKRLSFGLISPWSIFVAAILATVGLNILFPSFKRKRRLIKKDGQVILNDAAYTNETQSGDYTYFENHFSSGVKYMTGEISDIQITSSFGSFELYLNNAQPKNHTCHVDLTSSFGEVTVYIPASWMVVPNVRKSFGDVKEIGHCNPAGENVVYLNGDVSFGNLNIKYI